MNDNEEWGEIEPVETTDDFGEVEPLRWEDGDGGEERLPEGERNQWGGNLRNEGRRVLLRRDKDGKVNGYSTTSSMLVRHDDGKFAVVPTVVGGKELSQEEAVKHYAETGEHWGMADDEESAQKMAQEVHDTHMKGNQAKWNDWLHEHWDEVSDDIRNDRGMAYEHKKRTAPGKITLMERLANDDTDDERKKKELAHHWQDDYSIPSMSPFGMGLARPKTARKYDDKAQMDDLAEIATEAGLADWQVKRIRSESKTPEEMREVLAYVAGNRPVRDGEEPEKETAGWRSVPKTIVNTAGKMAAGFINLVGTVAGGVDEDARHAFMADDPMAKKERESFDDWLGRVHIDEKVKRMAKRNPAVRENLERYYKWEAPIAGKEGMYQDYSVMVQNGREGTAVGNAAIRDAKRLRNWLDENTPVGNSGSPVVDWLEGAASGIAQFAYLGPTMIAMSAADSYQQTHSTALESGKGSGAAEGLAAGSALFDGAMTAAFYHAPFRRWMNGKGIVPVQPVEKFTFGGLSKAMGRFNAKREFLNQGVAAIEAGGIMGVQGAGDTAFRQLASGQDLDLGEITIEGLKGVRDGVVIGAIMGAGRILNARIKGERDYEKVVRAAAQTPDGRLMLARLNPDGMMDLKRFIQEGIDVAKAHEKPAANFEADTRGNVAEGRAPAPDWKPTEATMRKFQELCNKAGLPPDAKLASDVLFDPRVANYLGDTLNAKFRNAANAQPEHAAIPEKPIIDAETGKVVSPSQALAKRVNREFGVEPAHFDLPQTADGKPGLVPMKWRDNKTGKENTSNLAHDPKTGVTIMEEADGTFTVHNDTGDSDGAKTIAEAVEKAKELALMGQYTELDRRRKRTVIENERATKYGKKNVAYFNTMTEAAEAIENGIARSGGRFLGLESADQLRDPSVQDRDAFYTPDGTTVVILDNVHEVGDISRILAHEIVGHGGPNGEFGGKRGAQVEFAENIRAKQFDEFKKQILDGNLDYVKASSMDAVNRNLGEVFAHYASANLEQEPSTLNKLISKVNDAARKVGMRKTYSASDVKTMLARWREAVKGTGGDTIDLTDVSPRFDFFLAEPPERPVEAPGAQGEAKSGIETVKPPEAPVGDSGASGAMPVEPRRMTSAEEVISSAKTPFNEAEKAALDGAADVSGIDATDEMPANRDFLSILSKDAPVVRLNPAKVDRSDAVLPNMKKDANRTSGITKPLSGEWHPTMGGIGAAWLTKDGKLVVITGRHRSELAERKGKSMLYYLYREADGFTKDDALIYDAVANIHDEKGTINDYLGFLDRINPTREQAEKAGILSGKGLVAWSLYKDATEAVRSATAMDGNPGEGQISPQQATVIAEAAPRDADKRNPSIQRQLLKTALGGMRGKAFDMYARIRADELSKTPVNENLLVGEQMDLFSSPEDQAADILAQRQSQYRTKKAQGYQTVAQNLRAALNKEGKLELTDEYAKDLGVTDKSDKKQLEGAYEKAVERANYWENTVRLDDADKVTMDAEINAAADAKAKKLAELKAKREAAKSGKPAPKVETKPKAEAEKNSIQKPTQKEPVPRPDSAAESSALNEKQATAFAEWRKVNPNAKIKSTWLKNGIVDLGYEDGSGVARQTFIEADGKRIASTPVHISWKDYDEIHGKGARRIEIESPASASVASKPAEKAPASAPAKTEATTPAKPKRPAEAKKVASGAKPAVWPEGWDNAGEEIKGYVAPQDGDIRPRREIAIAHRSGGSINAPQKIKGVVEAVDGDNVKVYYKDGWGYDQHDTFKKSEIVGVMPSPEKPAEGKETANSTQKRVDGISSALGIPIMVVGKGGKVVADSTAAAEAAVSGKQESGQAAPNPKTPSIRMKDEAAEKKAKAALDAINFDTSDLFADSTILSGDEVRKTMPGYNRLDWSTHVDRTGYVGPRLEAQFQRLLKERKGKGDGTVVFLAGGNGAGKSTVAAQIGDTHDFAIDSTLGNLEVAKKQIDAILANGQMPEIHFVYRTPGQALEGIAQRVMNGGHIVSPLSFANSHVKSRENLRLLFEAYGDKIHIHIYDNSVRGVPEITLEQLEAKRKIDHAKIREEANYYLGHLRERAEASGSSQGGVAGSGAKGEASQVDFDTPELTAAEEKYAASEDQTPTEEVMREVYGMTNDEIATAMKAAGMEPPKHVRKSDATAWQQAEALLSNSSYMAKLSRAVARFPRNIADYENNALNVLFRQRQNAVNEAQSVVDGLKETLDAFAAIPKDERDTDFNEEQKKTAKDYAEAKAKLAQAKALMFETGTALTRSSSEAGRRLRSNRGLIDQTDYSYAGISGEVSALLGGADKITPEMDEKIREIAGNFASLDEAGRDLATARLKAHAEKIVQQIKNGDKMRKMAERKPGDEAKRVMRNYNDALAQIEVGAAEVGGTLVGLSDQQYPAWGKWLRAIGEFHCFENPDITEEECIKAIVEDISPFMDGVDENQVRDALTGFGHNFRQSRYDSQRLMNDLRSQSRMKRQLDWMDETNTMPPLTGLVRDEPSDTTRNLQKQVQERKKEVPDAGRDERRLKGVLESAKTRVRNRIADLERAIATGEKIPGRERTVLEDIELREMKKRKDVLQKEYDELFKTEKGMTEEQRIKFAERMLGRELEHALEDLDRARSGDFSKRPKRPGVESPTLDVLRARLAEIRGQIHDLKLAKYEFGMTSEELDAFNARKMANREKAVARLAERIVRGDLRPQKKPQPPMPPEMQKRYDELAEQMKRGREKLAQLRLDAENATVPTFVRKAGDYARFVTTAQRALRATMDFSAVLRQAARITLAHPVMGAKAFGKAWNAAHSEANLMAVNDEIMSDPTIQEAVAKYGLHLREVDATSDRDVEMFHGMERNKVRIFGKEFAITDIPFFGEFMLKSERHYITYLNAASAELYSAIVNDKTRFPAGATAWQKKMVADMINIWNGSAALSKERRQALQKAWVNDIFWAPQLAISRVQSAVGYDVWHPLVAKGVKNAAGGYDAVSPEERKTMFKIGASEHIKSSLAMIALGALLKWIFASDDDWYDFTQADWFEKMMMLTSPKIGNTTIDLTGGEQSINRLVHQIAKKEKRSGTGRTVKFGGYGAPTTMSSIQRFMEGKSAPWLSELAALWEGRDYVGEDYTWKNAVMSAVVPLTFEDMKDQLIQNGVGKSLVTMPLSLLGAGGSTYDRKPYENMVNRFLESKKEYDAIDNDDLIDDQNKRLILDSIVAENPLMRDEVREDIAADIAQIRKDEARARKDEKEGYAADTALLSDIERGKAAILEKIRRSRR